jgi:hypothetical protein
LARIIYGLCDPRNGELRYVGVATNPKNRLSSHLSIRHNDKTYRANWLRSLRAAGAAPEQFEIERVSDDDWSECERFWIAYFRGLGCRLTNRTAGGEGGLHPSAETRAALSAAAKKRSTYPHWLLTPEVQTRRIASLKTPEFRQKISRIQSGRKASPEAILHRKAWRSDPERAAAWRQKLAATPRSEEWGRNISLGLRSLDPDVDRERRKKIGDFHRGKPLSPEHRAKLSAAHRARRTNG